MQYVAYQTDLTFSVDGGGTIYGAHNFVLMAEVALQPPE